MLKHPLQGKTIPGLVVLLFAALTACSPTRTVYIPNEWQKAPPPAGAPTHPVPENQEKASAPDASTSQRFVLSQPVTIKETEVLPGGEGAPVPVDKKPAEPQHLASMHLVNQAETALAQGRTETAISMFEQAIQVDVYNGDAFFGLARAWRTKGSREKALEFARKAEILFQDERAKLQKVYLFEADVFRDMGDRVKEDMYRRKASRFN